METAQSPRPVWQEVEVQSFHDLLMDVGEEGVNRLVLRPAAPDLEYISSVLVSRLGFKLANPIDSYAFDLAVRAGDVGVRLGAALAWTASAALENGESYEEWLARAIKRARIDEPPLTLDKPA